MTSEEVCFTSATDLAAMIRQKTLSPVELTQAFLSRIDALNPQLNAYVTVTAD